MQGCMQACDRGGANPPTRHIRLTASNSTISGSLGSVEAWREETDRKAEYSSGGVEAKYNHVPGRGLAGQGGDVVLTTTSGVMGLHRPLAGVWWL